MVLWNPSDIYLALIGGTIIGIATSTHYLLMGRVTGFSGIFYSLITFDKSSFYWKLSLMAAVMLASCIMFLIYEFNKPILPGANVAFDPPYIISSIGWVGGPLAGLLVGLGTKMGNGCTSGHGVCGLPRLSIRSIVAVCCFMLAGIITATSKYYIFGLGRDTPDQIPDNAYQHIAQGFTVLSCIIIIAAYILQLRQDPNKQVDFIVATVVGFIFGLGLVISGMVKRTKIVDFLTIYSGWDPTLIFVMISAVAVNFITFRLKDQPYFNTKFEVPTNKVIDWKLVLGACIFGVGWGVGGLCPGPAVALYPEFTIQVSILFMLFLAVGQYLANTIVIRADRKNEQPLKV